MIDWRLGAGTVVNHWVRNPYWVEITTPAANEEKAVILKAVFNGTQEWTALSAAGDYTVDWGDGNIINYASGVTAEHTYDYTDVDLYDSSVALGYKQAVITITPQVGQHLTTLNFHKIHSSYVGTGVFETGFLDIRISGSNLTSIWLGGNSRTASTYLIFNKMLEHFDLLNNAITDLGYLLFNCFSLQKISNLYSSTLLTSANGVYANCKLLKTFPTLITDNCTSLNTLYYGCNSGEYFPFLNTSNCLDFSNMHVQNYACLDFPAYDTAKATTLSSILANCYSLTSIRLYDTSNCTDLSSLLSGLTLNLTIPSFNTAKATNISAIFNGNSMASELPASFDFSKATNAQNAFAGCGLIKELPSYDFSSCQTFTSMLIGCSSLRKTGIINAAAGTVFTTIYSGCGSLEYSILNGCKYTVSLANCKFRKTNLEAFIAALGVAATGTQTLTISGNPGTGTITSISGTTTAGSKVVTFASTTGINIGDRMTGTGSPLTTAIAVSFQDTGDTVTLNNHQLPLNHPISFVTIVTTTGIAVRTIYYVSAPTANTFQLAATPNGAALPLTTNGTGTMIYDATVESINPNVSVTLTVPATSTSTSSKSFRALNTAPAVLHGFTISG